MVLGKSDRVAIQGIKGSYHYSVAVNYFGNNTDLLCCDSFNQVGLAVAQGQARFGVMAIENSIVGTILPNYTIINDLDLRLVGEYYLDIMHFFVALKGQSFEEIQEIRSHPMALLQCMDVLRKHPHIKLVETKDTATAAQEIADKKLHGVAAIASQAAAQLFHLDILMEDVQKQKVNKTRFFIVSKHQEDTTEVNINKASISFDLDDIPGVLATVLNVINNQQISLTKIQSMPIPHKPFQYSFYLDMIFEDYKYFEKVLQLLKLMTNNLKILGEYKNNF
ncbi:MAG: prephenate dehydratase [Luteibaculaceae bacterium]